MFFIFFPCSVYGALLLFAEEVIIFEHGSMNRVDVGGVLENMFSRSNVGNLLSDDTPKMPFGFVDVFMASEFSGSTFDEEVFNNNPKKITQGDAEGSTYGKACDINIQLISTFFKSQLL